MKSDTWVSMDGEDADDKVIENVEMTEATTEEEGDLDMVDIIRVEDAGVVEGDSPDQEVMDDGGGIKDVLEDEEFKDAVEDGCAIIGNEKEDLATDLEDDGAVDTMEELSATEDGPFKDDGEEDGGSQEEEPMDLEDLEGAKKKGVRDGIVNVTTVEDPVAVDLDTAEEDRNGVSMEGNIVKHDQDGASSDRKVDAVATVDLKELEDVSAFGLKNESAKEEAPTGLAGVEDAKNEDSVADASSVEDPVAVDPYAAEDIKDFVEDSTLGAGGSKDSKYRVEDAPEGLDDSKNSAGGVTDVLGDFVAVHKDEIGNGETNNVAEVEVESDLESEETDEFSFSSLEGDDEEFSGGPNHSSTLLYEPFDVKLLQSCIENGSHVLQEVQGQDVVLVVGKTGVGKSLFMQGIAGKRIVAVDHKATCLGQTVSTSVFEAIDPLSEFEIGHDKVSKTRSVSCLVRRAAGKKGKDIFYVDSPGWDDTSGPEVDIATSVMFSRIVKAARSLRLVVLINYASLLEDRGGAMREVLKLAQTFVTDFDKDKKSFVFLFTHTTEVANVPAPLDAARSCLADEILRIMKDTEDDEVKEILKFMYKSLAKQYGFVDVVHPLETSFEELARFIDTKLLTIKNPDAVANCGLTVKSKMKLSGQVQNMLITLRRLFKQSTLGTHETSQQLKAQRELFSFFVGIAGDHNVRTAYDECEDMFGKHLTTQRRIIDEQLLRAEKEDSYFGAGNIRVLKTSLTQLNELTSDSDEGVSATYVKKRIVAACENSHSRMTAGKALEDLESTLKELGKLKAWSDGFDYCTDGYIKACHSLKAEINDLVAKASKLEGDDAKTFTEESLVRYAQSLVILGRIAEATDTFSSHGIEAGVLATFLRAEDHLLFLVRKLGTLSTGVAVSLSNLPHDDLWKEIPFCLKETAVQAKMLQTLHAIFDAQAGPAPRSGLFEAISSSLDSLEALAVQHFKALCDEFRSKLKALPNNLERKLTILQRIDTGFGDLLDPRWRALRQLYKEVLDGLKSELKAKSGDLEGAARLCQREGMRDGNQDADKFLSFQSHAWFDMIDGGSNFIQTDCDAAHMLYRCRMEVAIEQAETKCANLQLLSPGNIGVLVECHQAVTELKQFETFEGKLGYPDAFRGRKMEALQGLRAYKSNLAKETKLVASEWLSSLKDSKKVNSQARDLTDKLDRLLAEIDTIEALSGFNKLKEEAKSSKEGILATFKTARAYAEREFSVPGDYETKADCLVCIDKISGFHRTDPHLPRFADYKEKARNLVANEAAEIEKLIEESTDGDKIDSRFKSFQQAKILDPYTREEATSRLRPLESLREQKAEDLDRLLDEMIARQDFSGIGSFLKPLQFSRDAVKKQKFEQHTRSISKLLKDRVRSAHARLKLTPSIENVQHVVEALSTLTDAQKELEHQLSSNRIKLKEEVEGLEGALGKKLENLVDAMLQGVKSNDFYIMGVNQHYAVMVFEHGRPFLRPKAKRKFEDANVKFETAIESVPKHVGTFINSSFQNYRELEKVLSSLQMASESRDPELPTLCDLYNATVTRLTKDAGMLAAHVKEHVTETGSYDDGIAVLEDLSKAQSMGLAKHMGPFQVDCKVLLEQWKEERPKLYDYSASVTVEMLRERKQRMDKLKNARFYERYAFNYDRTYKTLQQHLQRRLDQELDRCKSALSQRDMIQLRTSLEVVVMFENVLAEHLPQSAKKRQRLESLIVEAFVGVCKRAILCLRNENLIDFEALFPEMRLFAINFSSVLDYSELKKEFCLATHLVHDILKKGLANLHEAIAQHDFLETRAQVKINRTHGAFLADHYALLFEELKQCGKLEDEEWLERTWKICCEFFSSGRDLSKIKSFAILGVIPSASEAEIQKAYRQRAKQEHPDKKPPEAGDAGEGFRSLKDARDGLLDSLQSRTSDEQLFDSRLREIPSDLEKYVRKCMRDQQYDRVELLLERFADFQMVCNLVEPAMSYDHTRDSINGLVEERVHGLRVQVDTCWNERKYKELNHSISDLRLMENHFKSFPEVFPESWNKGIIVKVQEEIEALGAKAQSCLNDKRTATARVDEFRRCFLQMGAVLVELQMFKDFTKEVMCSVLESCLKSDWGYSYLFELGLSFHRGDDTLGEEENRIGQTLLSEFTHFKEVMTMVWNEETAQKPAEDTVRDIKGMQRSSRVGAPIQVDIDKSALLSRFCLFESAYKSLLGEFLPADSDKRRLARRTIGLANSLRPLSCASGWNDHVKDTVPSILAGIFALFTILKSGESFNRIQGNPDAQKMGDNLLMKPHNIQVLTLLHLLGCGNMSGESLESQLMQIRTGEGKSMILGAAASILGLLGFKVRCVCYSEYLSTRDCNLFEAVFSHLDLKGVVSYSKITTLSEDTTALKGDLRGLTDDLLLQRVSQPSSPTTRPDLAPQIGGHRFIAASSEQTQAEQRRIPDDNAATHQSSERSTMPDSSCNEVCPAEGIAVAQISSSPPAAFHSTTATEEILLVDEVDVFFGSDFYGQTYNQVTELRRPEIAEILSSIWDHHCQGGRKQRLSDIQSSPPYQSLIRHFPLFQSLLDNEIRLMLDQVRRVDEKPYIFDPENDRIGYKVLDTVSFQVTYGYRTVFSYLKEASNGNLRDRRATLQRVLVMPISCGQFSYANISPSRILGVSGTLEVMGQYEKDVLLNYGIEKFVFVPSVYGQSNFVFDKAGDGIYIERDKSDYFQKICEEIQTKTQKKRAVIVFFKDNSRLDEFKSSPFFPKLGRQKAILSEDMDPGEKEFVINKAATSGQVTLCNAVFGRGTDFFCKDDRVQDGGGVHIIQTFLSMEPSEEVQIEGRTARQGKKGSYQMVLLEKDLCDDFGVARGEKDTIPREKRHDWLSEVREKHHGQHWKTVEDNLKLATKRDTATHEYFDALLAGSQASATRLFKDLYFMIKKPPVPEEITVDVALLIDITGSMTPYCPHAISTIQGLLYGNDSIISKLRPVFPETKLKIRLGVLGYRDIDDGTSQFTESVWTGGEHFTESIADVIAYLKRITSHPSGGKDLAEDHLGAINRCTSWNGPSDWSSTIRMALLFTDAPAHGFVPLSSAGLPNVDGYSLAHPKGLTPASVAGDLASKGVNLLVCSYNPLATALTEEKLADEYVNHPDNSEARELKRISMVPQSALVTATRTTQPLIGGQPKHIVFVLDESGSMSGSWSGVVKSFRQYVSRRLQNQNETDLVSVVQFASSARVTVRREPIGSAPHNLAFGDGGTQFAPAATEASQVAASTPTSHTPTVVFMSDGGTNDAARAASTFAALNQTVKQKHGSDLDLHVVAFGAGADTQQLQQISRSSPKGRVHLSSDTVQLSNIFVGIAGGHVAAALQGEIAKEISEAVSETLSLEYLS